MVLKRGEGTTEVVLYETVDLSIKRFSSSSLFLGDLSYFVVDILGSFSLDINLVKNIL